MRRLIVKSFAFICLFAACAANTLAQGEYTFDDPDVDYKLVFPNSTWRVYVEPDNIRGQAEFIYGDRLDGYLKIRKESLEGMSVSELARRYRDDTLRSRPGYVDGKEERFVGNLIGIASSYEYTHNGKQMIGRIYYLKADDRTAYSLHFTGLRDKLNVIRNQTDAIARSLTVKK